MARRSSSGISSWVWLMIAFAAGNWFFSSDDEKSVEVVDQDQVVAVEEIETPEPSPITIKEDEGSRITITINGEDLQDKIDGITNKIKVTINDAINSDDENEVEFSNPDTIEPEMKQEETHPESSEGLKKL